jgi:hypothetical protein
MLYMSHEYKNTPDSLYSFLVIFIRNCKYSWLVINCMKMHDICGHTISRTLTISLILPILVTATTLGATECQSKQDYSKKSTHNENNDKSPERKSTDAIGIKGDQLIYCVGDLSSCHNVLANIICSNVKYCIVGDITPFVMSNPL